MKQNPQNGLVDLNTNDFFIALNASLQVELSGPLLVSATLSVLLWQSGEFPQLLNRNAVDEIHPSAGIV